MIDKKRPDWMPAAYAWRWSPWQAEIERASVLGWRATLGFGFAMAGCAEMASTTGHSIEMFVDAAHAGPGAVEDLRLMMRAAKISGFSVATVQAAVADLRSAPPLDSARMAEIQKLIEGL
jgi:hypothetical protein